MKTATNNGYNGNSGYAPLLRIAGDVRHNKKKKNKHQSTNKHQITNEYLKAKI